MNLSSYIDGLTRSAQSLPALLLDWPTVDAELRAHYSEALIELLSMYESARRIARNTADQNQLHRAWRDFRAAVVRHATDIEALMSVNPFELLAPSSVSGAPLGADAVAVDGPQLPLAA